MRVRDPTLLWGVRANHVANGICNDDSNLQHHSWARSTDAKPNYFRALTCINGTSTRVSSRCIVIGLLLKYCACINFLSVPNDQWRCDDLCRRRRVFLAVTNMSERLTLYYSSKRLGAACLLCENLIDVIASAHRDLKKRWLLRLDPPF
jgi:hypothetical protein